MQACRRVWNVRKFVIILNIQVIYVVDENLRRIKLFNRAKVENALITFQVVSIDFCEIKKMK